jgi:hypothetical protein
MTIIVSDIIYCPVFYLIHNISATGLCLRLKEEPTQLGPTERPRLVLLVATEWVPTEDGDRMQSPKSCVLNKRQDDR